MHTAVMISSCASRTVLSVRQRAVLFLPARPALISNCSTSAQCAQRRALCHPVDGTWTEYNRLDVVCRRHLQRLRDRSWTHGRPARTVPLGASPPGTRCWPLLAWLRAVPNFQVAQLLGVYDDVVADDPTHSSRWPPPHRRAPLLVNLNFPGVRSKCHIPLSAVTQEVAAGMYGYLAKRRMCSLVGPFCGMVLLQPPT
ncbi:hypothetical protein MRX96_048514 [Rhipicephalus microplus]